MLLPAITFPVAAEPTRWMPSPLLPEMRFRSRASSGCSVLSAGADQVRWALDVNATAIGERLRAGRVGADQVAGDDVAGPAAAVDLDVRYRCFPK